MNQSSALYPLPAADSAAPASRPCRIVLDTNVCLDLFVFNDPRWAQLLSALHDGSIHAVTRADCRMEWLVVLGYRQLALDEARRTSCAAQFDALITCIAPAPKSGIRLPVCSDGDDQKFLELARDASAQILITKDKALLKLGRKTVQGGLFRIIKPEAWLPGA
jgi:putative PIN family toxin of toxin-antitoxin system